MGKRTVRIARGKIGDRLGELLGKDVQVVTTDGRTHAGRVQQADAASLTVSDVNAAWTSRSRHAHRIAIGDIQTIIYDLVSPW
jgi:small nuclear ribonucleoprotein (snRNP)-like protein